MKKQELKPEQGKRLKKCLERMGKTQAQLAKEAFLSQQTISKIINGGTALSRDNAVLFSRILNVRLEYLLLESDYMTTEDLIHANGRLLNAIDSACIALIEALGYKITVDEEPGDYKEVSVYPKDTPESISRRIENAFPVSMTILQTPSGARRRFRTEEIDRVVKDIIDYARFKCESPFHRFDSPSVK